MSIFEINFWNSINDLDDRIIELESKEFLFEAEKLELKEARIRLGDLLERINNKKGLI